MRIVIEFNKAAFRHGISEADIRHAYKTRIYDASMGEVPEKYAVIGFDRNWNPLEIMYNPIDDDHINIFHAMKARDSFMKKLGL
jgi:uncharacterized DUF497 family protein